MEITIKLAGLPEALHHLADAIQGRNLPAMTTTPAIVTEETTPTVSAPPWDAPTEAPQKPVEAPAAPEEKKYTMDELGRAGAYLIDHGGMENLLKLLTSHGVRALTELKQEDYAQVADELRALGAEL